MFSSEVPSRFGISCLGRCFRTGFYVKCEQQEHGEGLQILHYEGGQKYEPHYDFFLDDFNCQNGGQRIDSVLMYISVVEEGREVSSMEQKEFLEMCLGGMSYLNVEKEGFQSNQIGVMHYSSEA
ncbi:hypothetical protein ACS0TY_023881 [Phlomoides rotata]